MYTIVISNPACGTGDGDNFIQNKVIPLLRDHGQEIDQVVVTEESGHAGSVLRDARRQYQTDMVVILSSGDGTLHEIINALTDDDDSPNQETVASGSGRTSWNEIHFVLVPSGTANALYSSLFPPSSEEELQTDEYKLKSVQSFLKGEVTKPLALAVTSFYSSSGVTLKSIVSVVVTSAALHASILHDSEALRKETPGIERFKIAAEYNITRWYNSTVKFLTKSSGTVKRYDISSDSFIDEIVDDDRSTAWTVQGPFEYFLSTVNVDRLEPSFKITPLHSSHPPEPGTMEIVLVRPHRDQSMLDASEDSRSKFSDKAVAILNGAYDNGSHVRMKYEPNGEIALKGDGPSVVEYVRCGGWEWIPDQSDEHAHIICTDGAIYHIEKGGKAACKTAFDINGLSFAVYA